MKNMQLLFTYGTLQHGNSRHWLLTKFGAENLGPATTVVPAILKDGGEFPLMLKLSDAQKKNLPVGAALVSGELYYVSPELLTKLDKIEGHPEFFTRSKVLIQHASQPFEAVCYLITPDKADEDWYKETMKLESCTDGKWNQADNEG